MSYWCFATVNGRLAEIHFYKRGKGRQIWAHAYVDEKKYKTSKEKTWIKKEREQNRFRYHDKKYIQVPGARIKLKPSA